MMKKCQKNFKVENSHGQVPSVVVFDQEQEPNIPVIDLEKEVFELVS